MSDHFVFWGLVLAFCIIAIVVMWRRARRQTEALRQAACIMMGLPHDTPMKRFERMHKEMRKRSKDI